MMVIQIVTQKNNQGYEYLVVKKVFKDKGKLKNIHLRSLGRKEKVTLKQITNMLNKYRGAKMFIKELEDKKKIDEMKLKILDIQPERLFNNQRVTSARVQDQNEEVANLDLWNDKIDKIKVGDWVLIKNAMAKLRRWKEEKEEKEIFDITLGYYGELEVVKDGEETVNQKVDKRVKGRAGKKKAISRNKSK